MNLAASLQGLPDYTAHPGVQRILRFLPQTMTALLVLVLAWQMARMTWLLWPAPKSADVVIMAPTQGAQQSGNRLNVQHIADAHLFGEATLANDTGDIANAPPTKAPLVLTGVMATTDPTKGYAFIGESAASVKFRRVGDTLAGGVRLHSVYPDRVMLDRGGRVESLALPRFNSAASFSPTAARPAPSQPTQFAENLRRLAQSNPAAFSEIVRPQPVFVGGTQRGYRVYPGRNRVQFARLGLQPGDLVTAVNGTSLSDPASSMQVFNTIASTSHLTLTIERNGQTQQLDVDTSQIDLPTPGTSGTPPQEAPGNAPATQ